MHATSVGEYSCNTGSGLALNGQDGYLDFDPVGFGGAFSIAIWFHLSISFLSFKIFTIEAFSKF